jgi:hypothetical protein
MPVHPNSKYHKKDKTMSYHDLHSKFLHHLALSEEYKRMKEACAGDPKAYYSYGAKEKKHKAKAYHYKVMLAGHSPMEHGAWSGGTWSGEAWESSHSLD